MKKAFFLLGFVSLFSSCSDGELVFEELNFSSKQIQICNTLYFKINNKELLLINLSNANNQSILDENAPINQVQNILTSDVNKIYYRTYSDIVQSNTICSSIPPAVPVVVSEFTSKNGAYIQYIRRNTVGFSNNKATINYSYTINFKNVTLTNGTSEIKYEDYPFGTILYNTNSLGFSFTKFANCGNLWIASDADEELILSANNDFSMPTTAGEKTFNLSESQFLTYNLYEGTIVDQGDCDTKTNSIKEQWFATSGQYVIKTSQVINQITQNVEALKHEIYLKNTTFTKDNLSFVIDELKIQEQTVAL